MTARRRASRAGLAGALLLAALACAADDAEPEAPAAPPPPSPAQLFARIDTTLARAIAQGQLAALQASDVALRGFAVQQVGRYAQLRAQLTGVARELGLPPRDTGAAPPAAAAGVADVTPADDALHALRVPDGASFDHAYVREALAVHGALLADLDAALRLAEDAAVRRALEQLRGAADSAAPDGPGAGER